MKNILIYCLAILVSAASFTSCEKDNDGPDGNNASDHFSVMLDGNPYVADGLLAYASDWGETVNIYGAHTDFEHAIYISVPKDMVAGTTYTFNDDDVFAVLALPDGHDYRTFTEGGEGQVTIESFDGKNIKGTFSFTAVDYDDPTNKIVGTEGQFNVEIRL